MENNKYYTPTIEEFHVGFEYQHKGLLDINQIEEKFYNFNYDLKDKSLEEINYAINNNWIRVKYLDQEDIESLGWVKHNINKNCYYIELHKNTFGTIYMEYYDEQETKWCIESDRHGETIFIGTIKNKSELKKLMKQLGIYE